MHKLLFELPKVESRGAVLHPFCPKHKQDLRTVSSSQVFQWSQGHHESNRKVFEDEWNHLRAHVLHLRYVFHSFPTKFKQVRPKAIWFHAQYHVYTPPAVDT